MSLIGLTVAGVFSWLLIAGAALFGVLCLAGLVLLVRRSGRVPADG